MKNTTPKFSLKDFTNLDNSEISDYLIASMEAHYVCPSMREIKHRAFELLDLKQGDRVVELGCGLGYDAESFGEAVGDRGIVKAIDSSALMINECSKRTTHKNVEYLHADANNLPFPDNHFDVCRADRLLVSQKNIPRIFSEAKRVLKPKGRLCITALDFTKITFQPTIEPICNVIVNHWQHLVENPYIGRVVHDLFVQNKYVDIVRLPETFTVNSYDLLKKIVQFEVMLEDLVEAGRIDAQKRDEIINLFKYADNRKEFKWSIGLITVSGKSLS